MAGIDDCVVGSCSSRKLSSYDNDCDYDSLACLLSSVYQPFVEIAPAVLMEAERLINNDVRNYSGDFNKFVDQFLKPSIDLLWRVQKLTKVSERNC